MRRAAHAYAATGADVLDHVQQSVQLRNIYVSYVQLGKVRYASQRQSRPTREMSNDDGRDWVGNVDTTVIASLCCTFNILIDI